MTKTEFAKMSLHDRLELLKKIGHHSGMRMLPNQKVHLYAIGDFFVEVYVIPGTEQIQWAEVQSNRQILSEYVKDIDLGSIS
ncbi:MAG: hypothetical protein KJ941_12730 [Bacteroidetes bacterium]|nr:hypothetical protein [Bacteroidota bacterium]